MTQAQALIFDLDGTLIHSAPDLQFATNEALATVGRDPLDLARVTSFIGNGVETLIKRALTFTGGADPQTETEVLSCFLDVYARNVVKFTRPYAGVVQALAQFRAKGIPLAICTNKPTLPAIDICDRLELTPYFDVIVGAEPDQPKKPAPEALLACLDHLGCPRDAALYVGDSSVDYDTARNARVAFRLYSKGYLNAPLPDLAQADRFDDWARHGIVTN